MLLFLVWSEMTLSTHLSAGGWLLFVKVKGSLHTMIFSKYTELLLSKNIVRIFWNYFWNILEMFFKAKMLKSF